MDPRRQHRRLCRRMRVGGQQNTKYAIDWASLGTRLMESGFIRVISGVDWMSALQLGKEASCSSEQVNIAHGV